MVCGFDVNTSIPSKTSHQEIDVSGSRERPSQFDRKHLLRARDYSKATRAKQRYHGDSLVGYSGMHDRID